MKAAEYAEILDTVNDRPWRDPARYPECVQIALHALGTLALTDAECTCPSGLNTPRDPACPCFHGEPSEYAEQALRQMARRAHFGGPLDEPTGEIL